MVEKVRKQIGDSKTLQFDLELFSDAEHPRSMIWGNLTLTLGCEPVWYTETEQGDEAPVTWAWIDFLEFLGNKWPWLILEERYPISINPLHPGTMRREAEKRWESMGEEQYLDEDETLFHFEARHDLSQGLKGIFLPSLFVLRQGKKVWLYSQETHLLSSLDAIKDTLIQLGDYLSGYVSGVQDNRAERAVCRWEEREKRVDELFWELRTGMHRELREKLENGMPPAEFWELDHSRDCDDNELMAAARLSGGIVSLDDQKTIMTCIKQSPMRKTGVIDGISEKILSQLDEDMRAYEQGYRIAQVLRQELELKDESRAEPESILKQWDVDIIEQSIDGCPVDAVAVWGAKHGPLIILNTGVGSRAAHKHGLRSTLAHEICHLLVDRHGMLPFSEVLGGYTPLYLEQRANACAAEFLMPRQNAVRIVRQSSSFIEALKKLSEQYEVSFEMVALQIKNSSLFFDLREEDKGIIQRYTERTN